MPSSARGRSVLRRDPLTTIFILIFYPIFFCLYIILHFIYDCFLKLISNIQWQRYIYNEARKRPRQLLQSWRWGFGIGFAGAYTAEKGSEERLLKRGNVVRIMGRLVNDGQEEYLKKGTKQKGLVPRHLALALASKPEHTRVLVFRAFVATFFSRKNALKQELKEQQNRREMEQTRYAIDSAKSLLQCCAFTGVEEVSIYDEGGRIKRALSGRQEWILEWPLHGEWHTKTLEADMKCEVISSTSCSDSPSSSTANTPRSYSTALNSTPSLYKKTSITSLRDVCEQDFAAWRDSTLPRLQLTACLNRTSYDSEITTEEPVSNGSMDHENVYHAKIKVNLLDSEDARNAIAKAASWISSSPGMLKTVEVKTIDGVLQAHGYPSEPDLLIIHGGNRRLRSLHGFPPWLVRLCEIYYDQNASPYRPLSSVSIEGAIASFSRSEQRYGR